MGRGLPLAEAGHLGAAAAPFHLAPAPSPAARAVQVQPRARGSCALADQLPLRAAEQLDGLAGDQGESAAYRIRGVPAPAELVVELGGGRGPPRAPVEFVDVPRCAGPSLHRRPRKPVDRLPEPAGVLQVPGVRWHRCRQAGRAQPSIQVHRLAQALGPGMVAVGEGGEKVKRAVAGDEPERELPGAGLGCLDGGFYVPTLPFKQVTPVDGGDLSD